MKNLGIKSKLIMSFLAASLLPLIAISVYSYWKSHTALVDASLGLVESTRTSTKASIEAYFKMVKNQVTTMARRQGTKKTMSDFISGFNNYNKEAKWSSTDLLIGKKRLTSYYQKDFLTEFTKQNNGKTTDVASIINKLDESQLALQVAYIADNENPLGNKHKLDLAENKTSYDMTHAKNHPDLREYLEKFGYYDIFLIDAETGNIVYSVFKELDFGTSLKNGPYAESSLAKVFQKALTLPESDESLAFADYQTYLPSYDSPASFVGSPIYENGKVIGVIAFQLSFDEINKITLLKTTNFKTLETFLVGPDFLMRSDTIGDTENRNVRASFRNPEKGTIRNEHMEWALKGENHTLLGKDYLGNSAVASFGPIEIYGVRWIIKSVFNQEEAFVPVMQMRLALIIGALCAAFIVSFVALWYARNLANKLTQVAEGLQLGANTVTETSQQIAEVSTRLSEASTEQAASLQETVASVDEISAMVQRNADSASTSSKTSEASTVAAQRGKEKVELMLSSINDISKGNEEIMTSIQKSNHEINEIVRVIQAIADKTKVINDIVFQTKLLSFNASVEAARAGEHGKGFAVVAEEVGNLASMSGKAATEISDMLDKSVHQVTQIVDGTKVMMDSLVKSSKDKVDFGTKTARDCASSLDEIMKNVSSVNELVREISTASQEQSTGIREITKAMAELDQVTQQNTASSNDASQTARELKDQAERLSAFVSDLSTLVHGRSSVNTTSNPSNPGQGQQKTSKVLDLTTFKSPKKSSPSTKKVVGLEFDSTPKSDDNRFEDV